MADISRLFDLADPRIKKIWDEKNTQLSTRLEYKQLGFTDYDAEIQDPQFENFTGLGLAQSSGELEPYNREDIAAGFKVTISPQKFTKAIQISEEMLRWNLWPKINNLVSGVSNSLNGRIDQDAAKIYYLGFGTTFFTGGDASALFAAAHSMKDGSTQSNTLGDTPLTYTNLKTAIQRMDRFYDDKGIQLLPCRKLKLITSSDKRDAASEALRSIGNPDSANRLTNVFSDGSRSVSHVVSSWIPSTTYGNYWFVIDEERASYMNHISWGWKPKFDNDKIVNNGSRIYTGSTMFKPGFQSFQFAIGAAATS